MSEKRFQMFVDGSPASDALHASVEEIRVTQEVDQYWVAQVKFHNCLSAAGAWQHSGEERVPLMQRLRIEISVKKNEWVPLIDGPVANHEHLYASAPGASMTEITVRDDSVYLNRMSLQRSYDSPAKTDGDLVREVLQKQTEGITSIDNAALEIDAEASLGTPRVAVQRATPIQFLRDLAAERGWHAYVLPSAKLPAKSRFCFKPLPTESDGLPVMKLLGGGRNLEEFRVNTNADGPVQVSAAQMSFADGRIVSARSTPIDHPLMADLPAVSSDLSGLRQVPAQQAVRADVATVTRGRSWKSTFALMASGKVAGCYPGVLSPYRVVAVELGGAAHSSNFVLSKVRHHITRSVYKQEFEALGNSLVAPGFTPPSPTGLAATASASLTLF
jgi:hypothetical protein